MLKHVVTVVMTCLVRIHMMVAQAGQAMVDVKMATCGCHIFADFHVGPYHVSLRQIKKSFW